MAATMSQLQPARFPMNGPSWDEEVVPALRKRLESESRTLAKRMSAVSLASQDNIEHFTSMHAAAAAAAAADPVTSNSPFLQSNASASAARLVDVRTPDRTRSNGTSKEIPISPAPTPTFQRSRSRTYSQPYLPDLPNGNGRSPRPKANASKSPRAPLPTRIPQPTSRSPTSVALSSSRSSTSTNGSPHIPNGHHQYTSSSTTSHSNSYSYSYSSNTTTTSHTTTAQDSNYEPGRRTPITIPRSGLTNGSSVVNGNVGLGLLNEPPPFSPASASSSITPSRYSEDRRAKDALEDPPRPSMESEERPFEHWYRGEVSRNGGVGELRVGRRQEMLEIANYGHTIRALERERREEGRRRKRADSASGVGGVGRERVRERGSLYLDEVDAGIVGRVLDEAPLTDLEGSEGGHYEATYDEPYGNEYPDGDDNGEHEDRFEQDQDGEREDRFEQDHDGEWEVLASPATQRPSNDTRSNTPTPTIIQQAQAQPRPSSRNTGSVPPSRIPARSRQSSESRVTTPTPSQVIRGANEPLAPSPSTSTSTTTRAPSPPQTRQRQVSRPSPAGKPKSRTQASKATRAKTLASRKEMEEEMKRRSVAYYPTPGGEGDEMMIDAIPEWTQPVPREGNWDDVVLPVVARKKGLDEHYQKADGNPTPRKAVTTVAPAPGTFGFDHSKYRPPRADGEPELIAMDEFGRPTPAPQPPSEEQVQQDPNQNSNNQTSHDQTRVPVHTAASSAPFSNLLPARVEKSALGIGDIETVARRQEMQEHKEEEAAGCCNCVIM